MTAKKLPSMAVCALASEIGKLSTEDRADLFALVAAASKPTFTIEQIEQAIAKEGNIGAAAIALGCSRRTLQNHMRQLGMPASRGGRPKRGEPSH